MARRTRDKSVNPAAQEPRPEGIEACRPADVEGRWLIVVLTGLTYLLSLPIFEPAAVSPLGYLVFVPWLIAIRLAKRSGWLYLVSLLFALAFWGTHTRWLCVPVPVVYAFSCSAMALHFVLAVWPIRHLVRRRGFSLTLAFPVVWTAEELFHTRGTLSTSWCLLAHSQIRLPVMMQIADLVGELGVTFVLALVNGWLADMVLHFMACRQAGHPWRWTRRVLASSAATLLVIVGTGIYGYARLSYHPTKIGPRVAVLQGDFLAPAVDPEAGTFRERPPPDDEMDLSLRRNLGDFDANKRLAYLGLLERAAATSPDLLVLPEMPWPLVLNREFRESPTAADAVDRQAQHEEFVRLTEHYQIPILVGAMAVEPQAPGDYPRQHEYNSAFLYSPGQAEPARYDKVNLLLVGEYLPFRYSERFFWLYRLLNDSSWNPWGSGGREYVSTPGRRYTTFSFPARTRGGQSFRFGVAICYEDTLGHEYRKFVVDADGRKRVDFMLTISNVGWFGHGSQQAQHLAACAFRAVENRVWIARATNTGISGFIKSDGTWYDLVGGSDRWPRAGGVDCRTAEAMIDPRITFYSRHGDILAWACLVLTAGALVDAVATGLLRRRREPCRSGL